MKLFKRVEELAKKYGIKNKSIIDLNNLAIFYLEAQKDQIKEDIENGKNK